jgi:DNA-binding IclR family transcriptional regulator
MLGTLDKAMSLLTVLADREHELGVSELSRALRIPKATTYRIVTELERQGLVRKNPESSRYQLGLALWELGRKAVDRLNLRPAARPRLEEVTEATRETSLFVVHDGHSIAYVERVDSPHEIQINPRLLGLAPFHRSAAGKIFLAFDPDLSREALDEQTLPRLTGSTIVSPKALAAEIEKIRKRGWASSIREWRREMSSVAAPVWNASDALAGAIVLSGPANRFEPMRLPALRDAVMSAARALSADLGSGKPHRARLKEKAS